MSYISYDQLPAYVYIATRYEMNVNFFISRLKEKASRREECSKEQADCQTELIKFMTYVENISTGIKKAQIGNETERAYAINMVRKMEDAVKTQQRELEKVLKQIYYGV